MHHMLNCYQECYNRCCHCMTTRLSLLDRKKWGQHRKCHILWPMANKGNRHARKWHTIHTAVVTILFVLYRFVALAAGLFHSVVIFTMLLLAFIVFKSLSLLVRKGTRYFLPFVNLCIYCMHHCRFALPLGAKIINNKRGKNWRKTSSMHREIPYLYNGRKQQANTQPIVSHIVKTKTKLLHHVIRICQCYFLCNYMSITNR